MAVKDGRTIVTLAAEEVALDRDFVLTVAAEGLDTPCAWVEKDGDGATAVAVSYVPSLPADPRPAEIIFLVDESGSMQGSSIEQVRNALQLCLRSMIPGCRFNIVSFGSNFEALFPESRPYDETSLAAASAFVANMSADRGGTEILPALESVLTQKHAAELSRQVVVLTDGQVSNTDAVLALAKAHANTTRVFTFGIGAGASRHLVQGLARAGGGSAESIFPGERIESKVVRLFGRLLAPAITDVALDWGTLDVVAAPSAVPPLFAGSRLVMYGFVKTLTAVDADADGRGPEREGDVRRLARSVADDSRADDWHAGGARADPRARGEPRLDRRSRFASGTDEDDRRLTRDHRPRGALQPGVARDIACRHRAPRDAGQGRDEAAPRADCADVWVGRRWSGLADRLDDAGTPDSARDSAARLRASLTATHDAWFGVHVHDGSPADARRPAPVAGDHRDSSRCSSEIPRRPGILRQIDGGRDIGAATGGVAAG